MSLLKKVGVLYLSNGFDNEVPQIEDQDRDRQRFLPWRTSLIPAFVEEPKLYLEFNRNDVQEYIRILIDVAIEYNLQVNGGGHLKACLLYTSPSPRD
eukprot:13383223-Alexandrium_andersonii.AAC.1